MAGTEVSAVAAEDLDPLLARVVDRVGDQVGDVVAVCVVFVLGLLIWGTVFLLRAAA